MSNNVRAVVKPQIKVLSPSEKRKVELTQLETRYKSSFILVEDNETETIVQLSILPSDPDFPFDIEAVDIRLSIPVDYPTLSCTCKVLNSDIPNESAVKLELGFKEQVKTVQQTLVRQMNWLDHHLEELLKMDEKIEQEVAELLPVKKELSLADLTLNEPITKHETKKKNGPKSQYNSKNKAKKLRVFYPRFTQKEMLDADKQRKPEFKQLETRFRDTFKIFRTTQRHSIVTLVLTVNESTKQVLGSNKLHIQYYIPVLYPLLPCEIEIDKIDSTQAKLISDGFNKYSMEHQGQTSLLDNLNWLAQNINNLLKHEDTIKPKSTVNKKKINQTINQKETEIRLDEPKLDNLVQFYCKSFSFILQCSGCKSKLNINQIQSNTWIQKECSNCSIDFSFQFIPEIIQNGLKSIGLLKLIHCSVYDILESNYSGKCGLCKVDILEPIQLSPYQDRPTVLECKSCNEKISCFLGDYTFIQKEGSKSKKKK